jgi:hypothetical protein
MLGDACFSYCRVIIPPFIISVAYARRGLGICLGYFSKRGERDVA